MRVCIERVRERVGGWVSASATVLSDSEQVRVLSEKD